MFSRLPDNVELLEITAVPYPIGSHVECFGFFLFHSTANDTSCGAVVGGHWSSWLWMSHVVEAFCRMGTVSFALRYRLMTSASAVDDITFLITLARTKIGPLKSVSSLSPSKW